MKHLSIFFLATLVSTQTYASDGDKVACSFRTRANAWFKATYENEPTSRVAQILAATAGGALGAGGAVKAQRYIAGKSLVNNLADIHEFTQQLVYSEASKAKFRSRIVNSIPGFDSNPAAQAALTKFEQDFFEKRTMNDPAYKPHAEALRQAGSKMSHESLEKYLKAMDSQRLLIQSRLEWLAPLNAKMEKLNLKGNWFLFPDVDALKKAFDLNRTWEKGGNNGAWDKESLKQLRDFNQNVQRNGNVQRMGKIASSSMKPGMAGGVVGGVAGAGLYASGAMAVTAKIVKSKCPGELSIGQASALAQYVDASVLNGCHLNGPGASALLSMEQDKLEELCEKIPNLASIVADLNEDHRERVKKVAAPKLIGEPSCEGKKVAGFSYFSPHSNAESRLNLSDPKKIQTDVKFKYGEFKYSVNLDSSNGGVDQVESAGVSTRPGFESLAADRFQKFYRSVVVPPGDMFENKRYVIGESIEYAKGIMPIAEKICQTGVAKGGDAPVSTAEEGKSISGE